MTTDRGNTRIAGEVANRRGALWFIGFVLAVVAACGGGTDDPSPPPSTEAQVNAVRVLTLDGGRLDWSPDGQRIAFDRFGADGYADVYVMNTDGSGVQCLTCDHVALGLPVGHKGNPVWHPGGNWIVFQAEMGSHLGGSDIAKPGYGFFNELWAVRADGVVVHRILRSPSPRRRRGRCTRASMRPAIGSPGRIWSRVPRRVIPTCPPANGACASRPSIL
jgi:hypothetical protein